MLVIAGGLVFASHSEGSYSAYDATNGKLLWNSPKLASGPNAPGVNYSVNGKQYASVFAGGDAGKQSDMVVAFAMPEPSTAAPSAHRGGRSRFGWYLFRRESTKNRRR